MWCKPLTNGSSLCSSWQSPHNRYVLDRLSQVLVVFLHGFVVDSSAINHHLGQQSVMYPIRKLTSLCSRSTCMSFLLHDSKFICTCIFDFCFISLQLKKQACKIHTDCYDHSTPMRRSTRGPEAAARIPATKLRFWWENTKIMEMEKKKLIQAVCQELEEHMHDLQGTWLQLPLCCMSPRVPPPDCQNNTQSRLPTISSSVNAHHQYLMSTHNSSHTDEHRKSRLCLRFMSSFALEWSALHNCTLQTTKKSTR